MNHVKDVDTD